MASLADSVKSTFARIGQDIRELAANKLARTEQVNFLNDYKTAATFAPMPLPVPHYYASRTVSAGGTYAQGSEPTIQFDIASDAGNVPYDAAANCYIMPVQGLWDVRTQVSFTGPTAAMRAEFILNRIRNGVNTQIGATIVTFGGAGTHTGPNWVSCIAPYIVKCEVNDRLYITVKPNGGTLTLYTIARFNFFDVRLLQEG